MVTGLGLSLDLGLPVMASLICDMHAIAYEFAVSVISQQQ